MYVTAGSVAPPSFDEGGGLLASFGTDNPAHSAGSRTVSASIADHNQAMAQTVLIVDDHPSFRRSARRVLEDAGYEVVGEAPDGTSALAAARELRPAIVLLDVQLPDLDGFEVTLRLTGDPDPPAVVLTSIHDRSDFAGMIARSGARGFLPKSDLSASALAEILS